MNPLQNTVGLHNGPFERLRNKDCVHWSALIHHLLLVYHGLSLMSCSLLSPHQGVQLVLLIMEANMIPPIDQV